MNSSIREKALKIACVNKAWRQIESILLTYFIFWTFLIDTVSSISFSCLCLHPRFSRTDLLSEKSSH